MFVCIVFNIELETRTCSWRYCIWILGDGLYTRVSYCTSKISLNALSMLILYWVWIKTCSWNHALRFYVFDLYILVHCILLVISLAMFCVCSCHALWDISGASLIHNLQPNFKFKHKQDQFTNKSFSSQVHIKDKDIWVFNLRVDRVISQHLSQ